MSGCEQPSRGASIQLHCISSLNWLSLVSFIITIRLGSMGGSVVERIGLVSVLLLLAAICAVEAQQVYQLQLDYATRKCS